MGLEAGESAGNSFSNGGIGGRVYRADKKGLPHVGDVKKPALVLFQLCS